MFLFVITIFIYNKHPVQTKLNAITLKIQQCTCNPIYCRCIVGICNLFDKIPVHDHHTVALLLITKEIDG